MNLIRNIKLNELEKIQLFQKIKCKNEMETKYILQEIN